MKDYNSVFKACKEFSSEWKYIGLGLQMKKTTLDIIKKDNVDSKERMCEMLASWLQRQSIEQPLPSRNILIRAISDSVGITEAQNVASDLVCGSCDHR